MDAGVGDRRRDLWLEPGNQHPPMVAGRRDVERAEKSVQVKPNVSRTRSRASDPLLKQVSPMKSPVGDANTCPVPDGSTRGSLHQAEDRVARAE